MIEMMMRTMKAKIWREMGENITKGVGTIRKDIGNNIEIGWIDGWINLEHSWCRK